MLLELDSKVNIIPKKTEANQFQYMKTKFGRLKKKQNNIQKIYAQKIKIQLSSLIKVTNLY